MMVGVVVADSFKQVHATDYSVAAHWMTEFLAQGNELIIIETELIVASYIYAPSNAEEVKLFLHSEYGWTNQIRDPPKVNPLVGKYYLARHCTDFLKQYRAQVKQCRESFQKWFFRLFVDYYDNFPEEHSFANICDCTYRTTAPK